MGVQPKRDFASLLDDLIAAAEAESESAHAPSIPFDYLSVVEELHSGRIKVSTDSVAAEYLETASTEAEVEVLFAAASTAPEDELLPVEPDAISQELGLHEARPAADFARMRRSFAFNNHPDRLPAHMRERAIKRMQIANMLIDEAKRKALQASRR